MPSPDVTVIMGNFTLNLIAAVLDHEVMVT